MKDSYHCCHEKQTFCLLCICGMNYLIFKYNFQTYRELLRLTDGVGFRVHIIDKASLAAKKYGPHSNKKYGKRRKKVMGSKK